MPDATPLPPVKEADGVPFLYFDHAIAFGHLNGVIQVELMASALVPIKGGIEVQFVPTARLRCNVPAATDLLQAIQGALEMAQKAQQGGVATPPHVN
jgi:hypothetical protein